MINWGKKVIENGFPETLKLYVKFYNLDVDIKIINNECHIIHVYLQQDDLEKVRNWINCHKYPGCGIYYNIVDEIKIKEFMKPILYGGMDFGKSSELGKKALSAFHNTGTENYQGLFGKYEIPERPYINPKPSLLFKIIDFIQDNWAYIVLLSIFLFYII